MNTHFWPENPKANFLQNWSVVSFGISEGYKTNLDFSLNIPKPKTNPIQTQFKPKLDQNKPKTNPIQTQSKPILGGLLAPHQIGLSVIWCVGRTYFTSNLGVLSK